MSRKCVNNPNNFCYICGEVTFDSRKCSITPIIKKAYFLYLGCKVGDQDTKWAPHVCCTTCSSRLKAWVNGKGRCMPFGVPMLWRFPSNHSTDLFPYGVPYSKWYVHEEKINIVYLNISLAFGLYLMAMDFLFLNLRAILHCTLTTKTVFLQTAKNNNHQLQEMQTTCQAQHLQS